MKPFILLLVTASLALVDWPSAKSLAVPSADGYVAIPGVALPPSSAKSYRAIFDATRAADKPTQLVPALNMAGSELNALEVARVPLEKARFAVVFHGPAVDGILDDSHYKAKFGINNPNLAVIAEMKKQGTQFFVCGQYVAAEKIDPKSLTPNVTLAADALFVLMEYQSKGYALLSF